MPVEQEADLRALGNCFKICSGRLGSWRPMWVARGACRLPVLSGSGVLEELEQDREEGKLAACQAQVER